MMSKANRTLSLVSHFFRQQYYGSMMGPLWLILEPIIFSSIVWFFFFYALKASPPSGAPFSGWLLCGMSIWILSSTAMASGPGFIRGNFLLSGMSQMSFPRMILAMQVSSLPVHFVFLIILLFIDLALSDGPSIDYLFVPLFIFLQVVFFQAFVLLLAVLGTFFRDMQSALGIVMQVLMWSSPIFWDPNVLPRAMYQVVQFNPMFLPISGYRYAFFGLEFPSVQSWVSYGVVTVFIWVLAYFLFHKTKRQLGDHV